MDFDNILDIASQNQGFNNVQQKRYSLQAGPPKKDPKSKGVNPAAVQALLKKKHVETKKKELEMKKQKEELMAKRVELKSDRKARAMASRTKDNFHGYNGIPVVEVPKKRCPKADREQGNAGYDDRFRNESIDPLDDEDNYEYEQTDSEPEEEAVNPRMSTGLGGTSGTSRSISKAPAGAHKPAVMNFADLLKLAEKKQFEPVELKPKVMRKEERLRTADELKELEMERKAKKLDRSKDSKADSGRDGKFQSSSSSVKKSAPQKDPKLSRSSKNSLEKQSLPNGSNRKVQPTQASDRVISSSKPSDSERRKTPGPINGKIISKNPSCTQASAKQAGLRPPATQKPSTSKDFSLRREGLASHQRKPVPENRPLNTTGPSQKSQRGNSLESRPVQGSSSKQGLIAGANKPRKGEPPRPGMNSFKSNSNPGMRPSLGGPPKIGIQPQGRPAVAPPRKPGNVPQVRPSGSGSQGPPARGSLPLGAGPGLPARGGPVPGRPTSGFGSGPGRPKCTVVSETISSKNMGGPRPGPPLRPGAPPRPGVQQRPGPVPRPGMAPRPMMNGPPRTMLPPITSAYKRKYEDEEEEYDPEMDDFIDDGGEEQDEISRHIKEIFGYDRSRYKDESDYALKFMESSWKDLQKEEARSLRMAVQEDLEEERREEEELKKKAKRKKVH